MIDGVRTYAELREMSELVADAIIKRLKPHDDDLSRSQAEKLYGAHWIKRVESLGLARSFKIGTGRNAKVVFSRHELDCIRAEERQRARLILEHK